MNMFMRSTLSAFLLASLCLPAYSAVRPQLTRIVAYASDKETPVEIINESSESYMVQSWLEDLDGKDANIPLVLTPPVMRLDGQKQGKLRLVVLPAEIPQDRESVYWLSIQEIPPKAKTEADNKVVIAIRSRLKVFVRPQGLNAKGAREAIKSITWDVEHDGTTTWLKANNASAYYISFGDLKPNGTMLDDKYQMPAPHGSQRYAVPKAFVGKKVTIIYSAMSDYGSSGEDLKTEVQL
ncbi:molecular chaperone [Hafnia paralvei]|uniref:fimbrial biogenesis chaperone n=1 Tax=Hafnia paralvei TaxID=546367 RepID=UPI0029D70C7B|nr:molecular chaperone [Hafnia paralvei]MDX6909534.1 molecular chaperone [Hafnia paralvei]